MLDPYPIIQVQTEWAPNPENMGSKVKFWYRGPRYGTNWLFKYPRLGTGEHWAEKIAAEVASVLGIRHAAVELAEWDGHRGSASESFVFPGKELVHGNQILEWALDGYDPSKQFHQAEHSLDGIWRSFDRLFKTSESAEATKAEFTGYLVLDAVIGNTDRHHENWGLVRARIDDGWGDRLAPSYDHASSLGRELLDSKRVQRLEAAMVGAYAEKGRGAIHLPGNQRHGPSPLGLIRSSVPTLEPYLGRALERLTSLRDSDIREIVDRVPGGWMSDPARAFAITQICYSRDQLLELTR